jgi:hypothetical protein
MIIFWHPRKSGGGGSAYYTDPGESNVKAGVTYYFDNVLKTGTYSPIVTVGTGAVGLPNVSGAMGGWFQPMTFTLITKSVVNYQDVEGESEINFRGVWQPATSEVLKLKPEGQRAWPWYMVHSDTSLKLKVDDVIVYEDVKYRVMERTNYNHYGYIMYIVVEDWVLT